MKRITDLIYLLATFVGPLIGGLLVGLAAVPPARLVLLALEQTQSAPAWERALWIGLSLGLGYYLFGLCLMGVVLLMRQVLRVRGRNVTAEQFYQPAVFLAALNNYVLHILHFLFLPLVRATPLLVWFYRALGMKVGRGTIIATTRIWDVDMIEIGEDCVIGGNAGLSAHVVEGTRGMLRRIKIGNHVNIGADTLILPGATIEDNVIVGANSLVPKDAVLERDSMYGGVPVQKIRSLKPGG